MNKITINDCINFVNSKNGKCLSEEYLTIKTIMEWQCEFGHRWLSNFDNIKRGSWCPECAGSKKLTLNHCINFANSKNGKCLSEEYLNVETKMEWQCKFGHRWFSSFNNIKRGTWCPECSNTKKFKLSDCIDVATKNYGKCLSEEYLNVETKMEWQCKFGHRWFSKFNHINNGSWCPECAGSKKLTLNHCINFANSKNGKCLSEEYKNAHSKLLWECNLKHIWESNFNNIKNGNWCPQCSASKNQKLLYNIIKDIFPNYFIKFNYKFFNWLKTKDNGKQELDIYVENIKLAIEYDGEQHFKVVEYFGGKEKLIYTKKMDKLKNKKIKEHKDDIKYFIRFNCKEKITKEFVIEKLRKSGVNV